MPTAYFSNLPSLGRVWSKKFLPAKPHCALMRTALERPLLKIGHIHLKAMLFHLILLVYVRIFTQIGEISPFRPERVKIDIYAKKPRRFFVACSYISRTLYIVENQNTDSSLHAPHFCTVSKNHREASFRPKTGSGNKRKNAMYFLPYY